MVMLNYFKKKGRKAKKPKQWYRPGAGRMATYKRVRQRYYVTGSRGSQYKQRKFRPVAVLDEFPITPGEAAMIREYRTPIFADRAVVVSPTDTVMRANSNPFLVTPTRRGVAASMWNPGSGSTGYYSAYGDRRLSDLMEFQPANVTEFQDSTQLVRRLGRRQTNTR